MKKFWVCLSAGLLFLQTWSQEVTKVDRPKLVVGIVVDQMRYDYLTRFYNRYGEDGFKRILNHGFNFENAHFNYIPTTTAVGHSSIYTGTSGSGHGVIANDFYDKELKKMVYCVADDNYRPIGTQYTYEKKSPHRMQTTTLTDELRLSQNMMGKTISISLKDRASVLPGGHTSNGSYWYVGKEEGRFITSSFYMDELPSWVVDFNEKGLPEKMLKKKWETLYPIKSYTESITDDNPYEGTFIGEEKPVFPHNLKKLSRENGNLDIIKNSPYGNTLVLEFAKAAIDGEDLGKGKYTDFLAISFSSPDYVGHKYGIDSKEVEDLYLRLDLDIAALLKYLDKEIGENNYSLFLTADHAAAAVPAYLQSLKVPAGYFDQAEFRSYLNGLTQKIYGTNELIENFSNLQVYLNREVLGRLKLDAASVSQRLADEIITYTDVYRVITAHTLQTNEFNDGLRGYLQNGYNQKYSGDILMVLKPAYYSSIRATGSTHGTGFTYDTHVPIMLYGKGIRTGSSKDRVEIIDIAPTMSNLLQISFPNGSTGSVLKEALK